MTAFVASTSEQARLLLDLNSAPLLSELMKGERGAADLARALGEPLNKVHYRLGKLVEANLVEVCGEVPRGGRAIKRYKAVAREFRVPYHLTDAATFTELQRGLYLPFLERTLECFTRELQGRGGTGDVVMILDDCGDLSLNVETSPTKPYRSVGRWGEVTLSPERAEAFRERLNALVEEFGASEPAESDAPSYLFGVMLVEGTLKPGD